MPRARHLLLGLLVTLACTASPAAAEVEKIGDLTASFDAELSPSRLPRSELVPVAIRVSGDFRSDGGAEGLPQLQTISVAINRQGRLFDRGLSSCRAEWIQPAGEAEARRICGGAIVGSGHVGLLVRIPGQPRFEVKARLLVFKGPSRGKGKVILAQAYSNKPPNSLILPFRVSHRDALLGTVLSTSLPAKARRWAFLTHFDMRLHRSYMYGGSRRSYVSAACRAPAGFSKALFPLARATYGFGDGRVLRVGVNRVCRVDASRQPHDRRGAI